MLNKIYILLIFLNLSFSNLFAQTTEYEIFQLQFLYNDIKFEEVISLGQKLFKESALDKNNLIRVHKYVALSFYNIGKQDSSRSHFYSLLSINPDFDLDPVNTSPKILFFYNTIKENFLKNNANKIALPYKSYIFVEDTRPSAALRSLILPGWGQNYKGQQNKGYLFGGAFLGAALSTTISFIFEKDLKDKYLTEDSPLKIKSRYTDYNNMSKTRRISQYTAIGIWALSVADALFTDYTPEIEANENYLGLALEISF
jgi:hypothetical protein